MKKTCLVLLTMVAGPCHAATGSARDGIWAILSVIGFLLLLLGITSLAGFVRKYLKSTRASRLKHHANLTEDKDLLLPESAFTPI